MREVKGTRLMNVAMSTLYSEGFWVPSLRGAQLGRMVQGFTKEFQWCAWLAEQRGLNRFSITPKLHMLAHQALDLVEQSASAEWAINPLATANQMQEDFVGRPCRLSRRVHPCRLHLRVLQRTLVAAHMELVV